MVTTVETHMGQKQVAEAVVAWLFHPRADLPQDLRAPWSLADNARCVHGDDDDENEEELSHRPRDYCHNCHSHHDNRVDPREEPSLYEDQDEDEDSKDGVSLSLLSLSSPRVVLLLFRSF